MSSNDIKKNATTTAAIQLPEEEFQTTQNIASPDALTIKYPKEKVIISFLTGGTLYQLIIFPFIFSLLSTDKLMGLIVVMFLPIYLLLGGLIAAFSMTVASMWFSHKKQYKSKGWWLYTFLTGLLINAVCLSSFFNMGQNSNFWVAVSLTGGISTLLISLTALPEAV